MVARSKGNPKYICVLDSVSFIEILAMINLYYIEPTAKFKTAEVIPYPYPCKRVHCSNK